MPSSRFRSLTVLGALAMLQSGLWTPAHAEEIVHFPSITYRLSDFGKARAKARGESGENPPGLAITGYLSRPAGEGRHPAIVLLHGCSGLSGFLRREAETIRDWGYVVLAPDSFSARGMKDACAPERNDLAPRVQDAMGALVYLSKLPSVDPTRIAIVGYSHGGGATLKIASASQRNTYDMPDELGFKAAATYYPPCEVVADDLVIPTLILIGERDDWTEVARCEAVARRQASKPASLKLTIFPGVFHSFNAPVFVEPRQIFGHWHKFDETATRRATSELRDFLGREVSK